MKRLRARSSAGTDIVESAPRRLIRGRAAPEGTDVEATRDVAESPGRNGPSTDPSPGEASLPPLAPCMPTAARGSHPIVPLIVPPRPPRPTPVAVSATTCEAGLTAGTA